MVDEAERSLHDALSVLSQTVQETRTVLGGGCSEMLMSCAVDNMGKTVEGKKSLAVEAFSKALRMIPTILADNAGWDSSELVAKLRKRHFEALDKDHAGARTGLDMELGDIGDMRELGITESYKLKRQVVVSASEAAEMILRSVFPSSHLAEILIRVLISHTESIRFYVQRRERGKEYREARE